MMSEPPLQIAFLLTHSLESPGGVGRYGPLARSLASFGHEVEIYALHPDFTPETGIPFLSSGVRVQYVAPMHVKKRGNLKSYYSNAGLLAAAWRATWRLFQAAGRSRATILHVCKPHPMNGVAGLLAKVSTGKRLFVDCDDYEAGSNLFGAGWQRLGVAQVEKRIPLRAEAVTTNSQFMTRKLIDWGVHHGRIHYLPNGVDLQRFTVPAPERVDALRTELGLVGKYVVGYIGSLSLASHPVDLLLRAFVEVYRALPESALLIVGGGEDFYRLQSQAGELGLGEQVVFTGRVAPENAALYYHLLDVSVDPVADDLAARGRSPLKLFESWACGAPFVTGDVGDRRLLLGDPSAGLLCRPADAASLAQAMIDVLRDQSLAERVRGLGLARVKDYTWDHLAKTVEQIYRPVGL